MLFYIIATITSVRYLVNHESPYAVIYIRLIPNTNNYIAYLYFIFNTMPKRPARARDSDDQSEEVEDVMAWGSSKQNYYKDSDNEYSSLEEEQKEARQIYDNQLEDLQDQDLYEIPQQTSPLEDADDLTQQKGLSQQYLTNEIKATVKLGLKISERSQSRTKDLLQTYLQSYLLSLIAMREIKIPYIEYHPIVGKTLQMKEDINKLRQLLDNSPDFDEAQNEDLGNYEENGEGQEEDYQGQQQVDEDQIQNGLSLYEQAKTKQQQAKKAKKEFKKEQRTAKKRPAFLQVKGNEGRLASEKILKNKGLVKKRKKIDRNSRVKLRRKFDKANSKRRAYGHLVRQDPGRDYEGERNIKYGRIASVKLK